MKQISKFSWLIQIVLTTIVLLFGFNYTNGKNCQLLEQTAVITKQNTIDITELRKADEKVYEKLVNEIHQLDKSIVELTVEIRYLKDKRYKYGN